MTIVSQLTCSNTAANKYKQLFATKALDNDLPGRLSRIIDLPISLADGPWPVKCDLYSVHQEVGRLSSP